MTVRADLIEVEPQITRLLLIGREFRAKDEDWSHLKNKEDWSRVLGIDDLSARGALEDVYSAGRDMALFMSEALLTINSDFSTYPTLTSIVARFEKSWVNENLDAIPRRARAVAEQLGFRNWAAEQMLSVFEVQLQLLAAVRSTLHILKDSDLYRKENGMSVPQKSTASVTIGNVTNSNIAVHSPQANQSVKQETVFHDLIEAIEKAPVVNKSALLTAAREMEASYQSPSFLQKYKSFIASAANHMEIVAPFLPALAALL